MFEKRFNWKIYFFIALFGGILLLGFRVILLLITNQITYEEGEPLPPVLKGILWFAMVLVCSTYAITFISLLKQVVMKKNIAFRVDSLGIHNTVVLINLFAFVIVCNIKFIPWSCVNYIDREDDSVYIRVKSKNITASYLGKFIIGVIGYHFCYSFISKKLTEEEMNIILHYCNAQSLYFENTMQNS